MVLAACSAMICIGLGAYYLGYDGEVESADQAAVRVAHDYLVAWRKRDFRSAMDLATGEARQEARTRASAAQNTKSSEANKLWAILAAPVVRLRVLDRVSADNEVTLECVFETTLAEQPVARQVEFTLRREDDTWKVAEMVFGLSLSQPIPVAPIDARAP